MSVICNNIMKIKTSNLSLTVLLSVFGLAGLDFLYSIGNSQLEETIPLFQFFADSNTYIKTYRGEGDEGAMVRIDKNYLGPLTILKIFQGNNYLILIFNVFVFAGSVIQIAKALRLNSFYTAVLLLISPLTVSTLLSVNKEIFLFPFVALALLAYLRNSLFFWFLALSVSLFVRWQLGVFCIVLILIGEMRLIYFTRVKFMLFMLASLSIGYLLIRPIIQPVLLFVQVSNENYQDGGSGIFERMLEFQDNGMYFLIFPIKAFHLLFGMGFKIDRILNPIDIYNDFFVSAHCAVTFLIFLGLIFKRKLSIDSDLLFISLLFLAFFCLTPVFAPRYLYLVFVLCVLVLLGAPPDLRILKIQNRPRTSLFPNGEKSLT